MSARVSLKWVDCKVDLKVELQSLCFSIHAFDFRVNVLCPQLKEHLVVSIIKRAKEVFLHV